ncbi:MAG: sulfatase [Pirellulales bacterium]|nr:sulfatase [Pirellulales bacterium]
MKTFASLALFFLLVSPALAQPPNFVVIFCDDLGYGDLGCYGSTKNRTPRIDSLATQGTRFTDFYSSSPVCTPSRSSLLTGCYPRRVGMHEDATGHWVLIPRSRRGLHPDEWTIAEALKSSGYHTACIGKWHLGDQPEHLPTAHGFDFYFGIPYSNDMQAAGRGDPPLPLVRQEQVIEAPADQSTLTQRYTEQAIKFIEQHQKQPFFLYLPHTFPHLPLFASPAFHGKSANGRYGDAVEEIDWSTGQILDCLDRLNLTDKTLVIFTSDNGSNGRNGGSNAPLSGAKGSTMEGGMRVPMLARLPGKIPAGGVCQQLCTTMDLLPTFCEMAGANLPKTTIDGHDISRLLTNPEDAESPYEVFFYYRRRQLQAIRWGDWKWHLPLKQTYPRWSTAEVTGKGRPGKLVNLRSDLAEKVDLSAQHPEVLEKMRKLAQRATKTLGNEEVQGTQQRPANTLATSQPMLLNAKP